MNRSDQLHELILGSKLGILSDAEQRRLDEAVLDDPEIAGLIAETGDTLDLLSRYERDEPDEAGWQGLADRISALVADGAEQVDVGVGTGAMRLVRRPILIRLGYGVAACLAGIALFWAGRYSAEELKTPPESLIENVDPRSLENGDPQIQLASHVQSRTQSYLSRSKVLLLGLVNADPFEDETTELLSPHTQNVARALIAESQPLRDDLGRLEERQLAFLVDHLEKVLIQISELEDLIDSPAIERVRSSVDQDALLLRINLTEMNLQDQAWPTPLSNP